MQLFSGAAEVQPVGDGEEVAQFAQVQIHGTSRPGDASKVSPRLKRVLDTSSRQWHRSLGPSEFGIRIRNTHQFNGVIVGKLDGKVAVITGGSTGMALAGAKLFVEEGAHVFITGRRQDVLDEAVEQIGRNVTGVQGDSTDLADLDRLYDTVK